MSLPKLEYPLTTLEVPSTKQKITIRPMVAREEKILLTAKESQEQADIAIAIKQVVNNCIITPKFDIDKLTLFDIEYLFIRIRAVSVSNIAKVSYVDNEDEKTYDFEIPLDKIIVQWPDPPLDNKIAVNDKVSLTLKYPSALLYNDVDFLKSAGDEMMTKLVTHSIDKVEFDNQFTYFEEESPTEQREFIDSLPLTASDKVREFLTNLPHLHYQIEYKNEKDHDRKIVLTTLTDFFTL